MEPGLRAIFNRVIYWSATDAPNRGGAFGTWLELQENYALWLRRAPRDAPYRNRGNGFWHLSPDAIEFPWEISFHGDASTFRTELPNLNAFEFEGDEAAFIRDITYAQLRYS